MSGEWIGVDLDGTLALYEHGRSYDPKHVGDPIPAMLRRVKRWIAEGRRVKILTARAATTSYQEHIEVVGTIQSWCVKHGLPALEVTAQKDYLMLELWDDRAVTVEANTGRKLARSSRGLR